MSRGVLAAVCGVLLAASWRDGSTLEVRHMMMDTILSELDWSWVVLIGLWVWIIYDLTIGEAGWFHSHREVMRRVREKNARRGITMRPRYWYKLPDGTMVMSQTGREKDMIKRRWRSRQVGETDHLDKGRNTDGLC